MASITIHRKDGDMLLLDSHGGGDGGPGDGDYIQPPVEEEHQDCGDVSCVGRGGPCSSDKKSVSASFWQDLQGTFSWLL